MLSPKEAGKGVDLYPYKIPYAADITAMSGSDALATNCTVSFWWDGGSGYEHVWIDKAGTTVSVKFDNGLSNNYTGPVGTTYHDIIKNVLTAYRSGWTGLFAELHCVDRRVLISFFGQYSPNLSTLWVPKEVVDLPEWYVTDTSSTCLVGGTGILSSARQSDGLNVFVDSSGYSANEWNANTYCPQWATYELPIAKVARRYTLMSSSVNSYASNAPGIFKLQGSNNGTSWIDLDSRSGITYASATTRKSWNINNTTAYKYYRLYINNTAYAGKIPVLAAFLVYEGIEQTYGPNGAYLDFVVTAALGNDVSGNNNDWSVTGTQTTNTPTN